MSVRRVMPFLILNIFVSAAVVLGILYWWDNRAPEAEPVANPTTVAFVTTVTAVSPGGDAPLPTPVPEQPEEDAPFVHVVIAGDTLGTISQRYEVSMDDIMAANGLTNPNLISVGQQLVIPIGGLPTPTVPAAAPTETIVANPTPIATVASETADFLIAIQPLIGLNDINNEAILIVNNGAGQVALQGWQLQDQDGNVYTFEQVTLFGGGAGITVHTRAGQDGATDVFWGRDEIVWQPGEIVTVIDSQGGVQAEFQIP